jgi:RNA polymerase sigma-70 factor, ECF subfamily
VPAGDLFRGDKSLVSRIPRRPRGTGPVPGMGLVSVGHAPDPLPLDVTVGRVQDVLSRGDAPVVEALRRGDEAAFSALVREYHASLLRVALVYVPSRAVAEEVVQETWLGVLNGIDRFEGRASLKTWIFRILSNTAKTRAAREGRTLPLSALANPAGVPEAAVEADRFLDQEHPRWPGHWASSPQPWEPAARLAAKETRDRLAATIERLPPNQRAVISLRDVEGWSAEEVCNALGLSETNQRVLLHRARSKVRRALEEYLREDAEP